MTHRERAIAALELHAPDMVPTFEEEIIANAKYGLNNGKPNGGYIFSTSNVAFKGMPLENYMLIHDVWKQGRVYV